jgi:hypothetical protein
MGPQVAWSRRHPELTKVVVLSNIRPEICSVELILRRRVAAWTTAVHVTSSGTTTVVSNTTLDRTPKNGLSPPVSLRLLDVDLHSQTLFPDIPDTPDT